MSFLTELATTGGTLSLCALHAHFLYSGYQTVGTEGIEVQLAKDAPFFNAFELKVGGGYPSLPFTGPLFYLCAVYFSSWFMHWYTSLPGAKKHFSLSGVMLAYNLYTTLLSGAMFALFVLQFYQHTSALGMLTYKLDSASTRWWAAIMWVNYQSKYVEYADTLIAVLRGKTDQVNDLQLIHHFEMGPLMYVYCKLCPGGQSALGPMINSLVHFIMYGYYGLTGCKAIPALTKAVKPYITSFQILQFLVLLVQSIFHMYFFNTFWDMRCTILQFFLMLQMIYMFKNFFLRAYSGGGGGGAKGVEHKKGE